MSISSARRFVLAHRDGLIAAAVFVGGEAEAAFRKGPPSITSRWLLALLVVVWVVPIVWRRRYPIAVLIVITASAPIYGTLDVRGDLLSFVVVFVLATYTVGRHVGRPRAWWGLALALGAHLANLAAIGTTQLSDWFFVPLIYGLPFFAGLAVREREEQIRRLAEESTALRYEQAEQQRRAVAEERSRIARELHDIASHSISVVTIQAQAVRRRLGPEHQREVEQLRAIESTARQALAEMRRLLGVLRAEGEQVELAPQPGLEQLPRLLDEVRAAGLAVDFASEGAPRPLAPGIDLTAYRIVQEGLTNVRKHAGGAPAAVSISYLPDRLEVRVRDTGIGPAPRPNGHASGHGLVGMRERVALYGGRLSAGPCADGGYEVFASLPTAEERIAP
jgi:signal transduction histidine kinase